MLTGYNSDKLQLCYMDTDLLVYHIKTKDFYTDITDDVEERFDTSGYCDNRPLPVGLNKKKIGLMKEELRGAITITVEICNLLKQQMS